MTKGYNVRSIEALPISYREPTDHNRYRSVCLVKITTEDGVEGWGECCTYFPEASLAAAKLVEGMANIVLGQNALHTETIWQMLQKHSWWYGTGAGIAAMAIAGIDIALWDIKGKILKTRVLDLLGGPVREKLPAIASLHGTKPSIEEMADDIASYTETGLHGAKVGFGKYGEANLGFEYERDVEFARVVIDKMGSGKELMIDCGVNVFWDISTTIKRAQAFEDLGVAWLEEPMGHDDPEGYMALRANSGIRIAYGERESHPRGVKRIVDTGTVDVVGLDPGRIAGITGFCKAAEICALSRRQANAHNFSTAIVGAASQALSFASPACYVLELQPVYGPAQNEIVDRPIWHENGYVNLPEGPGLGLEVDEALIRKMKLEG